MYNKINSFDFVKNNKTIILMRHSEATHNLGVNKAVKYAIDNNLCPIKAKENELTKKKYLNAKLSANGINNAKKQTELIQKHINIKKTLILSSPLIRTLQTANFFNHGIDNICKNILVMDCLIERRTNRPCDNITLDTIILHSKEETNEQVFKRTQNFISKIKKMNYETIIVITHKRFLIELSKNTDFFNNYGNSYFEPGEFRIFINSF